MSARWPAILLVAVAALLAIRLMSNDGGYGSRTQEIMATPITVILPRRELERGSAIVFETFRDVDRMMSEWKPGSPLAEANRQAGAAPVEVPGELIGLLERARELNRRTDGAFAMTWAALWPLWDFKAAQPEIPSNEAIAQAVELIDDEAVESDRDAGTVFLPRDGMLIGLGGIAKGHAIARAAKALRAAGIHSFLITAGGQTYAGGTRDGAPWRIGVRHPRPTSDQRLFATFPAMNATAATSGDYERYFHKDGVRYHHILDPRTGRPARGVRSVTVIGSDATLADALSTAVFVLGVERGMGLIEETAGMECMIVDDSGRVHLSTGASARVEIAELTGTS
jgi:thiamine biosynthesis lipoprotein